MFSPPIPVRAGVDLGQFMGRWYEIARTPFLYESFTVQTVGPPLRKRHEGEPPLRNRHEGEPPLRNRHEGEPPLRKRSEGEPPLRKRSEGEQDSRNLQVSFSSDNMKSHKGNSRQVNCHSATADYQLLLDGSISITNRCLDVDGHEISRAVGSAQMSAGEGDRAIFDVGFDSFYVVLPDGQRMDLPFGRSLNPGHTDKRNYWIHWLAPDFSLAIVGSPTSFLRDGTLKGNVWVLSRTRQVSQKRMSEIASLIKQIGYDPETVEATPETIMKMSS